MNEALRMIEVVIGRTGAVAAPRPTFTNEAGLPLDLVLELIAMRSHGGLPTADM